MRNNNGSVFITLAVADDVTKNITNNLETRWLQMILFSMKHLKVAGDYYNIVVLVLVLCMFAMLTIRYALKYRRHFMRQRRNETQHVNA